MARAPADHLRDILEAVAAVAAYTRGGRRDFDRNPMLRDAVVARLIQIGQAIKDAQAGGLDLPRLRPEIPWREIAGMRDRLAHAYWSLDAGVVWGVVKGDLPRLRTALAAILPPRRARGARKPLRTS